MYAIHWSDDLCASTLNKNAYATPADYCSSAATRTVKRYRRQSSRMYNQELIGETLENILQGTCSNEQKKKKNEAADTYI